MSALPTDSVQTQRIARGLLLVFAFAAWSLTGLATAALLLLLLLFIYHLPGNWPRLRPEPGFQLMAVAFTLTAMLAARAAWMLPETAADQGHAIWDWGAPFLFVVIAWWLDGDPRLARGLLIAAVAGLVIGLLRKTEWSDIVAMLHGERYRTGYSTLGLGFLASQVLVGLVVFQREITGPVLAGWQRRVLGWALWGLGILFFLAILLVTQARGAALSLAAVAIGYSGVMLVKRFRGQRLSLHRRSAMMAVALLVPILAGTVLWASRDRIQTDIDTLEAFGTSGSLSYASSLGAESSLGTRLNLYRIGVALFAERPLLGWGPGTTGTKDLVPAGVIPLTQYDLDNAPKWAHLHSVAIELLVRFGLLGVALAVAFLAVMRGAYGRLQAAPADRPLAHFFLLGGILTLLYCIYDFRLIHVDMQFFVILLCGVGYRLRRARRSQAPGYSADAEQG